MRKLLKSKWIFSIGYIIWAVMTIWVFRTFALTARPREVSYSDFLAEIKGFSTINARAESIATSKVWCDPVKKRRCLVPASAFYEWPKDAREPKQPYTFEMQNGSMFAFAGLWDAWMDKQGHWLQSFAIVTTDANELMARIHPRMPVILHARDYDRWLDRGETVQLPLDLLRPYEADPLVGNARNNGPGMLRSKSV